MTNRENVFRALRKNNPENVPFEFVLCPSHIEEFKKRTGSDDYLAYYNFPIRYIDINESKKKFDSAKYYTNLPENASPILWNPDWGIMGVTGSVAHFQKMLHPMANLQTIEEIDEYPFPDFLEEYRWIGIPEKIQELKEEDLIVVAFMEMTTFEIAWYLRGMDTFMIDMIENKEFAEALLDKISELHARKAEKYAKSGADILMLGDDIGTQQNMMISPELWRDMIKPRLAKVIASAKNVKKDMLVLYHSDGNIQQVIPDLIEIGVDILNPVQPECMDPIILKELYGDNLSFWGTLGTQTTLPFGTPEQIRETCKNLIEKVGKGGGLLLAPTHMVEPEVSWDNLQAFIDAVHEYGQY